MASYPKTDPCSTPARQPSFAEQAAATEFGRDYVHPRDRAFVDHEPWQKLGEISDRITQRMPDPMGGGFRGGR